MLKKLRHKKTQKRILTVMIILIIPGFVIWGSISFIRGKQETTDIGNIFGKKVSYLEYKDAFDAVKNQLIMQFGDNLSEIQKNINLEALTWDRLILLAEAKKRRIKVSDKELIETIENYPFFQRKGHFDNAIYSQMLQYVFYTSPRIFEEQIRQNIMLAKLYKELTDGISVSEEEIKEEYKKFNEQISLYYIAVNPLDFTKDINPTDEELKDYFTKNPLQFKQPLSFNLEYILYTPLASDEKNQRDIIPDKVKKILWRLNKKEDFYKVAKDFGLTVKETGLFGESDPIPGIGWSSQILNSISNAKAGQYLAPVKSDNHYYILRLKERKEPFIPNFEDIKDKVRERFIKDKSEGIAKQKIESCLKKLKETYRVNPKAVDFDNTAKLFNLKSSSTDLFKYGSYIEGIGPSDNLWIAAQNLDKDRFSEIIDMPSGFYIIKLKSKVPFDEKKFQEEKTEFSKKILALKKDEFFAKFFEELKKRAQKF